MTPLDESIAHWERLLDCKTPDELEAEGYGEKACALCQAHKDCKECPVYKDTGRTICDDTPYRDAYFEITNYIEGDRLDAPRDEIWAELNYLRGLKDFYD